MKVHPEMMSSRDNLSGRHIAVNWEDGGTWFIGLVLGPRNKSFNVRWFVDGSETVLRLRHFGFTKKTGAQDWRLVSRNSDLFDIQAGHSRGMIEPSILNLHPIASKAFTVLQTPLTLSASFARRTRVTVSSTSKISRLQNQ
jgi:hypothetical protein